MQLSEQTQAILLLTAWFGKQDSAGSTPLTPTEWGRFALFLLDVGRKPADLLHMSELDAVLTSFGDKKITSTRVRKLLDRSAALGIALEKWQRAGLWVITRSDADYPRRWKQRLKNDAPPVLFGAGNRDLLNRGGIAVVGSRDLDESQVAFTGQLGRDIAFQGLTVISGGARGADEAAMLGALESDGMAVGVLADSLLRACTSSKYRKALMSKDLALVSPFNPEAGFNVGNAMARNKYIYCLSDAAIVIAATENKGGTWSGAVEDLKQNWVPLWVRQGDIPGNRALVDRGANWLPNVFDVQQLVVGSARSVDQPTVPRVVEEAEVYAVESTVDCCSEPEAVVSKAHEKAETQEAPYELFLRSLVSLLSERELSSKEIQIETMLKQKTISVWLRQAVTDGVVMKTKSPAKYRLCPSEHVDDQTEKSAEEKEKSVGTNGSADKQTGFGF